MFLRKLGQISPEVLAMGAISGEGVWGHWSSRQTRRPAQVNEPASVSTQDREATPVPKAVPAPRSQPQTTSGSPSLVADNCPDECPSTRAEGDRPNCPISMAAHALRGMLGHVTEWSMNSK